LVLVFLDGRLGDHGTGHHDLVRLGFGGPHNADGERGTGRAFENALDHGERDVACVLAVDRFEDVAVGEAGLVGRTAGDDRDDCRVTVTLGDVDPGLSTAALVRLVGLVVVRGEIAGVGVERFQQAAQRAAGDGGDVRLRHVVVL